MATENKTKATSASVAAFLKAVPDADQRADCAAISKLMEAATKAKPKMWGTAIVGFGENNYINSAGREVEWMKIAFSPRKAATVLYGMRAAANFDALLKKLGKVKTSGGCIHIKRLSDVDLPTLKTLIQQAAKPKKA